MKYFLYCLLLISIGACTPYPFLKKGHFINEVDEYFNLKQRMNIWVYMDFLTKENTEYGVRMDSLYPMDRTVFQKIGLGKRSVHVLFSAVPKNLPRYHFVALLHKTNKFDYVAYEKFQGTESFYYFKDFELDFVDIRHVVIPYGSNGLVSLLYYIDKDRNLEQRFKGMAYLAEINARELQRQTPFNGSWQVFDCETDELISTTFHIRQHLTKQSKIVYLKMYAVYSNDRGITYAKILTRDDPDTVRLKLCPNVYVLEYVTPSGQLMQRDSLSIGF